MSRAEKTQTYRTIPDRKVKRNIARYNMRKAGMSNSKLREKNLKTGRSFFSENWKNYCTLEDN